MLFGASACYNLLIRLVQFSLEETVSNAEHEDMCFRVLVQEVLFRLGSGTRELHKNEAEMEHKLKKVQG